MNALLSLSPSYPQAPAANDPAADSGNLAEAFRLFNKVSAELADTYQTLQSQVARLTAELAATNGALRQQYIEKAALTAKLTRLLEVLPAGVVVVDADDKVVEANPAAVSFGIQMSNTWTNTKQSTLQATAIPGEFRIGNRLLALTTTALDASGAHLALLHDISETHQLKTQAQRHERLAAMGELAAQLAHQLRTPLAAALLYAGNLENPRLSDVHRVAIAQKTVERLRHLERLIQEMLLFARGEASEALGRERFDAAALVTELAHTFEPLAARRRIQFIVSGKLSGKIHANRKALVGALGNLIDNAMQAAGDGVGVVELLLSTDAAYHRFRVRDNGPGIAAADLEHLFRPFFTTRAEGTGLGLAIARGIARAHGGGIEAISTTGAGAEFILTISSGGAPAATV